MDVQPQVVIDCTGDADVAAWAGAPFEQNTEVQPLTLHFRIGQVQQAKNLSGLCRDALAGAQQRGELPYYYGPGVMFHYSKDEVYIHGVRVPANPTDAADLSRAEMQGARPDAHAMFKAWKRDIPAFAEAYFIEAYPWIGVRESRRIIGQYVLNEDDLMKNRRFDDAIATGCWYLDKHPNNTTVGTANDFQPQKVQPHPYDIPYRSLVPQKVGNLLVAGRCHSATRGAHASTRVTATAMAMGEAAGCAAAMSLQEKIGVAELGGVQSAGRKTRGAKCAGPTSPMPEFLAIEIGGSKLQLFAGTGEGRFSTAVVSSSNETAARKAFASGSRRPCPSSSPNGSPRPLAWAMADPSNGGPGRIWKSYHIAGWSDFPMGDWLREQAGLPAFVENDSNLATLGEARCGAGKGMSPVFYTNMGSGVGGGLAIEGRLYHGAPPGEMEFGHLRLEGPDRIVEDDCAGWSLDRQIRALAETAPDSTLAKLALADPGGEARHLSAALAAGDAHAQAILDALAGHLAKGLGMITQMLHPEVIVIGGGVSLVGESLRAAVAERLPQYIMDVFHPGPAIRLAGLREEIRSRGSNT